MAAAAIAAMEAAGIQVSLSPLRRTLVEVLAR